MPVRTQFEGRSALRFHRRLMLVRGLPLLPLRCTDTTVYYNTSDSDCLAQEKGVHFWLFAYKHRFFGKFFGVGVAP